MQTEGVQAREQSVVAPTVADFEVREQVMGAFVIVRRTELELYELEVVPGGQQLRVATKLLAQSAEDALKVIVRVLTTELIPRDVKETVLELAEQTAVAIELPLAVTEQAEAALILKPEGKATVRSKLVEEGVMAVSWMVNWALLERAVLGVTRAEVTEKLTCACAMQTRARRRGMAIVDLGFISFELQ